LSLEEEVLLAAPGDFLPEIFISGSGVLVPLPRLGRFLAFYKNQTNVTTLDDFAVAYAVLNLAIAMHIITDGLSNLKKIYLHLEVNLPILWLWYEFSLGLHHHEQQV